MRTVERGSEVTESEMATMKSAVAEAVKKEWGADTVSDLVISYRGKWRTVVVTEFIIETDEGMYM